MGRFWTLPELNWRYQIRRRVDGNVCVLPWNVLLCAVVYFVVRVWSVSSLDETVGVFPCEAERPGQLLTYSLFSVVQNCPEVRDS